MKAFTSHRWTAALFAGLLVVGFGAIGRADAGEVVDGNPTCAGYDRGAKFENPSGTYVIDEHGLYLTFTVGTYPQPGVDQPNHDNAVTSYTVHASSEVTSGQIIVKGSSGAIIYQFGEATPLHSPVLENGKWPTISHVQICWDEPEYGRVDITKAVTGDDAPTTTEFEICITGPAPDTTTQCHTVTAGGHAVFEQLEPGTYAVTETDPGTNWTVGYADTTLTVVADQTATSTVTNTYDEPEPEPGYGRVAITKAVTGDGAPATAEFELCITGPAPGTDEQCEIIGAGDTATFEDLEPGTYAVTETDPGANWTAAGEGDLTVTADTTSSAIITNTYEVQEQLGPVTPPTTPTISPSGGTVTPTAQPEIGDLPVTGPSARMVVGQAGIAATLLALGATLVRLGRRPEPVTA